VPQLKELVKLLCEKYQTYLKIAYHFGNKVITLKQLFQYARVIGITLSQTRFRNSIKELEDNRIIEVSRLIGEKATQLQFITLKKNAIMFLENKGDSRKVAPVPKTKTNDRILVSIFRNAFILERLIPQMQRNDEEISFDSIYKKLDDPSSMFLYDKNQGYKFLIELKKASFANTDEIEVVQERIAEVFDKRKRGLEKAQRTKKAIGNSTLINVSGSLQKSETFSNNKVHSKHKSKREMIDTYSFDSMLFFNAFVNKVRMDRSDHSHIKVTVGIYDLYGSKNVYRIATHVARIYKLLRLFILDTYRVSLVVRVFTTSKEAANVMNDQNKQIIRDSRTKEEGPLWEKTLISWLSDQGISGGPNELQRINVIFDYFDIENQFFEGKKYLNLKQKREV
jgi:hypothetical protein